VEVKGEESISCAEAANKQRMQRRDEVRTDSWKLGRFLQEG
jgi:hypothetical protein